MEVMKTIRFFKQTVSSETFLFSFLGVFLSLVGFLMGLDIRGFHGLTLWFQFPVLIFCFFIFCLNLIGYIRND